jgi:hypothetical protein
MPRPRVYTVRAVVGGGSEIASQKGAVTKALKKGDAESIVSALARLVLKSDKSIAHLHLGLKFLNEILPLQERGNGLGKDEFDAFIREAWTKFKQRETSELLDAEDEATLERLVMDAAKRASKEVAE